MAMKILNLVPPLAAIAIAHGAEGTAPPPPAKAMTPAQAAGSFILPKGYKMQLVLSEPQIAEPVVTAFDGNGRMFVAEMRTYMQDIDGNGQHVPTSRISMHVDTKGDGNYDKHTVFADNLLLPRMILPLDKGRILINETNSNNIYLLTDTNNDGVADKKETWYEGGPRGGNLEHQPSGLIWALDNGIYTTYNSYRLRWTPNGPKKEETKPNGGQWGLNQDSNGNLWFVNASGEKGPNSFQVPVVYGMFNPVDQFEIGFKEVFPAVGARDFQGGLPRVREPEGTLTGFTAGAGIEVYRGDQLPADLQGNVLFGEPVGRLVRRSVVTDDGGFKILSNPYQAQKSEFLRSNDLCFRPVNLTNAPDGTLYISDMYRGIIQEAAWVNPGSYLRKVVEQYQFDKIHGLGRVWRLTHETTKPVKQPRMYDETTAQLVAHLGHPNGWWRDTAQRLIILRQDKSVVPQLVGVVKNDPNPLARIHALWTLQGLDSANAALVREKMADKDPKVRANAIRVSETLFREGDASFQADIEKLGNTDPDPGVVLQACLTAKYLAWPDNLKFITDIVSKATAKGVKNLGSALIQPPGYREEDLSDKQRTILKKGQDIYATLCAACHGADGKGTEVAGVKDALIAPPLAGSKLVNNNPNGGLYVLLKGMQGDIEGKKYEGLMIAMANNDDEWISSVLSYVRNSFGNRGSFITPQDVDKARKETASRTEPWTYAELMDHLPQFIPLSQLKASASEKNNEASRAIDGNPESRYSSGKPMTKDMWFQVELNQVTPIAGVVLDSTASKNDYPRGCEVSVSLDGKEWTVVAKKPEDKQAVTDIRFNTVPAKFIRITQTGSAGGNFWSIHELNVLQEAKKR